MTWRVVAATAAGTSHTTAGVECQDRVIAQLEAECEKLPMLSIFVADGAGTASRAGTGADLAIAAAAAYASLSYAGSQFALNDQWAKGCIQAVREKIFAEVDQHSETVRDYACTFLGVVATPHATLLMQIGDGGIVIDLGSGLIAPIKPMVGEYVNMTRFVTDDDAIDVMEVKTFASRADKIAVFSDGVQRLCMNMATNMPHSPFFDPFFTILSTATKEQEDHLASELLDFLQSRPVNERTDDDKTLALAYWIDHNIV